MNNVLAIALSIAVIFSFVLAIGSVYILLKRPRKERVKGLLMLGVAAVTLTNVWLLTAPV